ncbi:hypothetical protein NDU88_005074 [Pleurodeles waltl]|uniref:Uncharacterized protein n=1 Tax=Pleurodeles waltl TaxID=8319 RepID=A0AAV7MV91_PLEWA|nr:hypothetical protein NDU88_005074 [Pleurodeles waltl]
MQRKSVDLFCPGYTPVLMGFVFSWVSSKSPSYGGNPPRIDSSAALHGWTCSSLLASSVPPRYSARLLSSGAPPRHFAGCPCRGSQREPETPPATRSGNFPGPTVVLTSAGGQVVSELGRARAQESLRPQLDHGLVRICGDADLRWPACTLL